jgi:hypothetical protein
MGWWEGPGDVAMAVVCGRREEDGDGKVDWDIFLFLPVAQSGRRWP